MKASMQARTDEVEFSRGSVWLRNAVCSVLWRLELKCRAKTCAALCRMGHFAAAKKVLRNLTEYK